MFGLLKLTVSIFHNVNNIEGIKSLNTFDFKYVFIKFDKQLYAVRT